MSKILLVDDQTDLVLITKAHLRKAGHEILIAWSGEECREVIKKDRPDIILLDIMMPGESGWEVCKKLKEDEKTRDIPVVLFSVLDNEKDVEKSMEYAHADGHITKPYEMQELHDIIKKYLKE